MSELSGQSLLRLRAALGLTGAAVVMLLSLSAFVTGSPGTRAATGTGIGQHAPDFSLRAPADGDRVSLRALRGQRVMLLFNLPPAELAALSGQLPAAVQAIALVETAPVGQSLVSDRSVVVLHDLAGQVRETYRVGQAPTAVVINAEGVVTTRGPVSSALTQLSSADTARPASSLATAAR